MHWKVIQFANENNIDKYDLGGLGVPSIDKFKKSFGGAEVQQVRFTWKSFYISFLYIVYIWINKKNNIFKKML